MHTHRVDFVIYLIFVLYFYFSPVKYTSRLLLHAQVRDRATQYECMTWAVHACIGKRIETVSPRAPHSLSRVVCIRYVWKWFSQIKSTIVHAQIKWFAAQLHRKKFHSRFELTFVYTFFSFFCGEREREKKKRNVYYNWWTLSKLPQLENNCQTNPVRYIIAEHTKPHRSYSMIRYVWRDRER